MNLLPLNDPDSLLSFQEQQQLLWASLKSLPEDYCEPLVLFYREDKSVEQVAKQLGLSNDAVKQRLSRGRARCLKRKSINSSKTF